MSEQMKSGPPALEPAPVDTEEIRKLLAKATLPPLPECAFTASDLRRLDADAMRARRALVDAVPALLDRLAAAERDLEIARATCPVCRLPLHAHEDGCVVVDGSDWRERALAAREALRVQNDLALERLSRAAELEQDLEGERSRRAAYEEEHRRACEEATVNAERAEELRRERDFTKRDRDENNEHRKEKVREVLELRRELSGARGALRALAVGVEALQENGSSEDPCWCPRGIHRPDRWGFCEPTRDALRRARAAPEVDLTSDLICDTCGKPASQHDVPDDDAHGPWRPASAAPGDDRLSRPSPKASTR